MLITPLNNSILRGDFDFEEHFFLYLFIQICYHCIYKGESYAKIQFSVIINWVNDYYHWL